ncbi:hypothetical protein C8Q73DRAFT_839007 [Cubamyces lactineus]|nr:hypothetical protein C8Q73DRAFT_839007 [Cubamyces lactineus]
MNPNPQNPFAVAAQPSDMAKGPIPEPVVAQDVPPSYYAVYVPLDGPGVISPDRPRNVRRRRFWHFTACALLLLVFWRPLVYAVAKTFVKLTTKPWPGPSKDLSRFHLPASDPSQCVGDVNWTLDPDGGHGLWPLHATTSLTFPVDADELFFLAQGSFSHGAFEVSQSNDAGTDAVVDIEVWYKVEDALQEATVCRLHPSASEHGLGIFTPRWDHPRRERQLHFHVHLRLPASSSGSALSVNKLSTNLPLFSHHLSELADTVLFKSIDLRSTNAPMTADSLNADVASLRAVNGKIEGSFTSSTTLDLTTDNAPIRVHVNLVNQDERNGTVLRMNSRNGDIKASVDLETAGDHLDLNGGAFRVQAMTFNAPVELAFTNAPANSLLNASAVSSNAPVRVLAHPTFEGTFELHSSWYTPPSLIQNKTVEDPLGWGRKRDTQISRMEKGAIRGKTAWTPAHPDAKNGHIGLETSNSRGVLVL